MTISITIDDAAAIETYSGLVDFLTEHNELSATTVAQLPNLIRLAEYRLNRLLLSPLRETSATVATVAGVQTVALPTDLASLRQVRIIGNSATGYPLGITSPAGVEALDHAGRPVVCSNFGGNLLLGPVPDAVYSIEVRYMAKLGFISEANPTNWLLADHADAYIYMCSATISLHHGDKEMAGTYVSLASEVIAEVNRQGMRQRAGGQLVPMVMVP